MEERKNFDFKKILNKIPRKYKIILIIIAVTILFVMSIICGVVIKQSQNKNIEPEISVSATLEKIVKTSDLSTFEAVYNGIATVMNEKKPDKVDFHVSYEAKVKAGIDVKQIEMSINEEEKTIYITLPEITLGEPIVDISTLDYIFENEKANTEDVSAIAYKACIADVKKESDKEDAIFELAKENAQNIVKALVIPFAVQLDSEYEIVFSEEVL